MATSTSIGAVLDSIVSLQKQQQECIRCIVEILTNGGHGPFTTTTSTTPNLKIGAQQSSKKKTGGEYALEREVRKACKNRQEYNIVCQWYQVQSPRKPFLLLHEHKPLLAQHLVEETPSDKILEYSLSAPEPDEYTIVPTNVPIIEDEIEIADDIAERFHALLFVKLLLFILLFDLDFEYMAVLIIIFFLHINGIFDPLVNFWRRRRHANRGQRANEPLERVLQNLEQRRNIEREVQAANEGLEDLRSSSPPRPSSDGEPLETDTAAPSAVLSPVATAEEEDSQQPSYLGKVIYQTAGMFFGTLLPWWKPDQRYLS